MFEGIKKLLVKAGGRSVNITGARQQAVAHMLAGSFERDDPETGRFLRVIFARDNEAMESLSADLRFFLNLRFPENTPVVLNYPADDFAPFSGVAPDRSDVSERLGVLHRLSRGESMDFLVVAGPAVLKRVMPGAVLDSAGDYVLKGVEVDRGPLAANLDRGGYLRAPMVDGPGQYAVRGGIIDIWSPLYDHPVRMEFLGDLVDRMRFFDPESQRTFREAQELYAPPVSELVISEGSRERAIAEAAAVAEAQGVPTRAAAELKSDLEDAVPWDYPQTMLPAFYGGMATLGDYLGGYSAPVRFFIVEPASVVESMREFLGESEQARIRALSDNNPCLSVDRYYLRLDQAEGLIKKAGTVFFSLAEPLLDEGDAVSVDASNHYQGTGGLREEMDLLRGLKDTDAMEPLTRNLRRWMESGRRVVAAFPSRDQADRLAFLLGERGLGVSRTGTEAHRVFIAGMKLSAGLVTSSHAFFAEDEVFSGRVQAPRPRATLKGAVATLMDLKEKDCVVHVQYGVGMYRGLKKLALWGAENDFFTIEYRDKARVYLPVQRLSLIRKYRVPDGSEPRLDRLGSGSWENTKAAVRDELLGLASELIKLQALRKLGGGIQYSEPGDYFMEFCATFDYDETEDQEKAISDVLSDMQKPEPMDRLIVGDVGFGKTEVAIRAAFKAVEDGRQVAVLVPTTVLAQQHYINFQKRMDRYPVRVGLLSRFVPREDQKKVIAGLASGSIDIVIGTHRILQKDISYKSLGLLVVDEEHRFGVAHKERIKKLAAGIDILTLTATPIPRTLHMSFEGLKDFSIIQTPPPDRYSVKTKVMKFDEAGIREAMEHELNRGGQVFFVHDRVFSIGEIREMLERIVPQARIGVAHGQMGADDLEKVMLDFIERRINVLLCTTIIGAGLDIPTANTIIIDRAETLGLSQLYQLRGRVGRGHSRAYAYLLLPKEGKLLPDARERLEVMSEFQHLGAGFNVAMRDLEMRGAGNLLGKKQHGHIAKVGFDMYMELLEQAMSELKGRSLKQAIDPEVKLPIPAFIPEDYIGDVPLRLDYYQRMSCAGTPSEVHGILDEIEDRFGRCPQEVRNLADIMALTVELKTVEAESLEYGKGNVVLRFARGAGIDPGRLVDWVQRHAKNTKMTTDGRLIYNIGDIGPDDLVHVVQAWVGELGEELTSA
jgi:transcription-repair coupling factor (superfamily II helicase)